MHQGRLGRRSPQATAASNLVVIRWPRKKTIPPPTPHGSPYTQTELRHTSASCLPPPPPRRLIQPLLRPNPARSFTRTADSAWRKPGWPPETSACLAPGASQATQPAAAAPHSHRPTTAAPRRRWLAAVPSQGEKGGGNPTSLAQNRSFVGPFRTPARRGCAYNAPRLPNRPKPPGPQAPLSSQ